MMNDEWRMENGEWRMENGEWRMENGEFNKSTALILWNIFRIKKIKIRCINY